MPEDLPQPFRILHVEDSESDHLLLQRHFRVSGIEAEWRRVEDADQFAAALREEPGCHAILCDHHLPRFCSTEALQILQQHDLDLPFILVSGAIGEMGVLEAMKAGAHDYVAKDNLFRLVPALTREMHEAALRREKRLADARLKNSNEKLKDAIETLTQTQNYLTRMERFRALGQIATGVAHDFNNGLTKILGITELLMDRCPEEKELLNDLLTVARDSGKVVQRLRSFYKANPVEEFKFDPVDLNAVIEQSIQLTRPKWGTESEINRRRILIHTNLADIPPTASDESELREVFTNLIFNACDAMPGGGDITISTREEGQFIAAEIRDSGEGMTEETRRRCLEPFFTTKGEKGTGLGLGLVDSVLKRYGGRLNIESQPGQGTAITIYLVRHSGTQARNDRPADMVYTGAHLHPRRILIVDDDPMVTHLFKDLLELDGHWVSTAQNGPEALGIFSSSKFDIVITDRAMPFMNGDELSETLKEMVPGLPVIMSTGLADIMMDENEYPPAIDYLLPKPVSRSSLRQAISKCSLS